MCVEPDESLQPARIGRGFRLLKLAAVLLKQVQYVYQDVNGLVEHVALLGRAVPRAHLSSPTAGGNRNLRHSACLRLDQSRVVQANAGCRMET